jgi:hypothetical protein
MRLIKGLLAVATVAFSLMLIGCLSGGGGGGDSGAASTTPTPPPLAACVPTADFFHLVVVPDQTVSTATFEVQVIAESIIPTSPPCAPTVIDGSGTSHAMALKTLKWPGTAVDSVQVYSAVIPLVSNTVNNIKAVSGAKQINFAIRHKPALLISTASDSVDLVAKIRAAMIDPSIDVVEIDYNEPDLGSAIHNSGAGVTSVRTTWLTIRPALGRAVSWVRNTGSATARPMVDFLHLDRVTFGDDLSDGGGGQFYIEVGKKAWLSNVEFRAKYKFSWDKNTPMTANYVPEVRVLLTEGQKVYFTNCLWDGTASTQATNGAQLARDLQFNSHRGDFNNFGKVVLNVVGIDISPVLIVTGLDYTHNDIFQMWGAANDIVVKGVRIGTLNIPPDIQPFHFGQTSDPALFSNILMDNVFINGATTTTLQGQLAGTVSNSRLSNLSYPQQSITIRGDFTDPPFPNAAYVSTNVRLSTLNVKSVLYVAPVGGTNRTYNFLSVANPADISPELSANPAFAGTTFTSIAVKPGP